MAQTSAYRLAVIADTPVLYVPCDDDGTGGLVERKSLNLVTANNTPTAPADFNDGWTFNGTDEYLSMAAGDTDNVAGWVGATGAFSIELWFKQNNGWSGTNVRKLFRWGPYGFYIDFYGFPAQADAYLRAGFYDVSSNEHSIEEYGSWLNDAWHHVVVTFDRPTLNLYVDGNLVQTESRDFDIHITGTGGDSFAIGEDGPFSASYFPGSIDDVAIYNYALTETQIDAHFVASKTEITDTEPDIADPSGPGPRQPPEGIASSFHASWDTLTQFAHEVHVDLTVMNEPTVNDLYFWALQCSFYDASDNFIGGGHTGLQWNEDHPNNNAVNWGGYDDMSVELSGTTSSFPSTPGNVNTRDYDWDEGATYSFRIWISAEGEISASVNGDLIRTLYCPGAVKLGGFTMWSEVFAQCSDPSAAVKWTNMRILDESDVEQLEEQFSVNYQAEVDDGCLNTNTYEYNRSIRQQTNTTRITPQDAVLVLQAVVSDGGSASGVGFIPIA